MNEILSFFILTLGITNAMGLPIAKALHGRLPGYIAMPGFWILSSMGEEIAWRGYALPRLLSGCISFHDCLVSRSEETSRLTERRIENVQT